MIASVVAQGRCKTRDLPQTPTLTRVQLLIIPQRSIILLALTLLTLRAFVITRVAHP